MYRLHSPIQPIGRARCFQRHVHVKQCFSALVRLSDDWYVRSSSLDPKLASAGPVDFLAFPTTYSSDAWTFPSGCWTCRVIQWPIYQSTVSVNVVHVEMPNGAGRKRRDVVNLESFLWKKDFIVQIKNKDDLCCARSIRVAKAKLDKDLKYKSIVSRTGTLQGRLAQLRTPRVSECSSWFLWNPRNQKVLSCSSWLSTQRDLQGAFECPHLLRSWSWITPIPVPPWQPLRRHHQHACFPCP